MTTLSTLQNNNRSQPKQSRSKKTVERLLDGSANLLKEVGFNNFTTNLLSERTGISIRAIYRYFPNKHALVMELALRLHNGWQTEQEKHGQVLFSNPDLDWQTVWLDYLDRFIDAVRSAKGGLVITQAMRSDPILKKLDDEIQDEYVKDIASSIMDRAPKMKARDARALSSVLVLSARAIIDSLLRADDKEAKLMLGMLKKMHIHLISEWLEA